MSDAKKTLRETWNESTDEEKVIAIVAGAFGLVITLVLLVLIIELAKALFVPALIALAVYSAGVKFFDWPLPKFAKRFIK